MSVESPCDLWDIMWSMGYHVNNYSSRREEKEKEESYLKK